ncbi:MAG TPA: hypothetical protein VFC84_10915 [Desulfosporosinus sp.]|nr:hypothetical protein [Desulfosporosinus sp.]
MAISGNISDLKLLIALFGNVTIQEILVFQAERTIPDYRVA